MMADCEAIREQLLRSRSPEEFAEDAGLSDDVIDRALEEGRRAAAQVTAAHPGLPWFGAVAGPVTLEVRQ